MDTLIKNGEVYSPERIIQNGAVLVRDRLIHYIGSLDQISTPEKAKMIDAHGKKIIPGLIDTHIHGAGGYDMTGSGVEKVAQFLPKFGITSFLASTHFLISHEDLLQAVGEIADVIQSPTEGAKILGIHMEGPWIASDRSSMSQKKFCYPLTLEDMQLFQAKSKNNIRMITFAPELGDAINVIPFLKEADIIPSVGHSNADYALTQKAIVLGVNHSTHTFNGMQPLHQRNPGLLGAILNSPAVTCELIGDGYNVQAPMMELLIKIKGLDKVCLISDAVPIAGMPAGAQIFWNDFDIKTDGENSMLLDGRPAGGFKLLNQILKVIVEQVSIPFRDVIHMSSTVPAKMLGEKKGQLVPGYDADLVILNEDYSAELTMVEGKIVFSKEKGNNEE